MALEQVDESKIRALLPSRESTPELPSSEKRFEVADWEEERRKNRIRACLKLSGLTDREQAIAKEKFIITDENRKAYEAGRQILSTGDCNLLFCGAAGRGKSRIAYGVVCEAAAAGVHSVFWTTTNFLMTLRANSMETNEIEAMRELLSPKLVVLDDFGANKITEWSLMMMDTVIDDWYRAGRKGLIITSNFSLDKIGSEISDRIASRLAEMCRVFEMKGKDWRVAGK